LLQRGQYDLKFQVGRVAPTNHFSSQITRINDFSYGIKIWAERSSVLSQSTRLTDGQTDRRTNGLQTGGQLSRGYRPRCMQCMRCMRCGRNYRATQQPPVVKHGPIFTELSSHQCGYTLDICSLIITFKAINDTRIASSVTGGGTRGERTAPGDSLQGLTPE